MDAGTVIAGRYELVRPIGRGGMGEVWAGYDGKLDRRIAVKLLRQPPSLTGTEASRLAERFVREARITARLEHPGVPAVFDAGAHGDQLYLVMQLVVGDSLSDVIAERERLPIPWAAGIAAQICSVLASAHAESLVHRDLKPSNLMLCPDGVVKVLDFGIAAVLGASELTKLTRPGETLGTPAYMAPEQALTGTAGPHSDLYALGCVLHEMLAGEPPFTAETELALLKRQLDEAPASLRSLRDDVPAELEALVLELLAKDAGGRPSGATEVHARLLAWVVGSGAETGDPTRPYRYPLAPVTVPATARQPAPADDGPSVDEAFAQVGELVDQGRYTQAAEVLATAVASASTAYGPRHPAVLRLRMELASVLMVGGDYQHALPEYEALAVEVGNLRGSDNEVALECRFYAASCRAALGDNARALREFQDLLGDQQRVLPADSTATLQLREQIGYLLAASGDTNGARRMLSELLGDQERLLGEFHPAVADLRHVLAHLDEIAG